MKKGATRFAAFAGRLAGTFLLLLPVCAGVSQQVPQINGGLPGPGRTSEGFPALPENANPRPDSNRALEDSMKHIDNLKRMAELNELRQKEMTSDTAKLLALANQLKAEVSQGTGNVPQMEQMRQVEAIEKLAHGVQLRMKATISN